MKIRALVATAAMAFGAVAMAPAPTTATLAAQDAGEETAREVAVQLYDGGEKRVDWTSDVFVGLAPDFFAGGTTGDEYECDKFMEGNCEYSLIAIEAFTDAELAAVAEADLKDLKRNASIEIGITNYLVPASDLDIILWNSNAEGEKLDEITRVGDLDEDPSEAYQTYLVMDGRAPVKHILLEVVYFAGAGTYDGYVSVNGA